MRDRIAEIRDELEYRDVEEYALHGNRGLELKDGVLLTEEECAEVVALLTRYEEARKVVRFYADPVSVKEGAKWSDGYPGGIVYEESGDVVIDTGEVARRWLEGEG